MGIKDLWTILTPFCERKPLYELQGKIVAVDLSCWICEAQNVSEYHIQPRMYLRNLYFRTCYLLLMEVTPVFVLEGKAPTLKYQTIADRNAIQFKGAKPKSDKVKTGKDRTRFHYVLKQCEDMLRYMGLACVQGIGEAEAMCASLNEDGMVAGCISQDSDCFAYGAQIVYRNFSISHQGSYAASGGAVDVYDIQKANEYLKFGRNKIIALALLCGSDYNDGVHGVGKDSAMKFMNKYKDDEILDRMRSWRKEELFTEMKEKISNKVYGKENREEIIEIKNELQIRRKAIEDPEFPNENLINEFLVKKDTVAKLDLKWRQPNLINFVQFTNKFLGWEEIYAFEKLLPILTRWQILNYKLVNDKIKRKSITEVKGILFPDYIKKTRNPKGISSYEIIWVDRFKYFENLIPEEQLEEYKSNKKDGLESLWSTIEPKHLVEEAYPSVVEEFLDKKNSKGKKAPKRQTRKQKQTVDDLTDQLLNTSLSEPKPKRGRKKLQQTNIDDIPEPNKNATKPLKTIESYYQTTKVEQLIEHSKLDRSFDLNASRFSDDDEDLDISNIVDQIVSRSIKLPDKISKLGYQIVLSNKDTSKTNDSDNESIVEEENLNKSCFFETNYNEVDLFEKTFDKQLSSSDTSDVSDSEQVHENDCEAKNKLDDTFDEIYVPLFERIKKNTRSNTLT